MKWGQPPFLGRPTPFNTCSERNGVSHHFSVALTEKWGQPPFLGRHTLNPAIAKYAEAVVGGMVVGTGRLPGNVQKLIEWIGVTYNKDNFLPSQDDFFTVEVKLNFRNFYGSLSTSTTFNVSIYGDNLKQRVAEKLRDQILRMVEKQKTQQVKAVNELQQILT